MLLPKISDLLERAPVDFAAEQLTQLTLDVSKAHRRILISKCTCFIRVLFNVMLHYILAQVSILNFKQAAWHVGSHGSFFSVSY